MNVQPVAFREVGKAYADKKLATDLRARIVVSPITAFEVLSQLSITNADEVFVRSRTREAGKESDHIAHRPDCLTHVSSHGALRAGLYAYRATNSCTRDLSTSPSSANALIAAMAMAI